jgi:hypothetical protein
VYTSSVGDTVRLIFTALDTAEKKIVTELAKDVLTLLDLFQWRLALIGIMMYQLYAKFFHESPTPCNDESWCFTLTDATLQSSLHIYVSLRKRFNDLVGRTNRKLVATINDFNNGKSSKKAYYTH